jgi:hypothetical protein
VIRDICAQEVPTLTDQVMVRWAKSVLRVITVESVLYLKWSVHLVHIKMKKGNQYAKSAKVVFIAPDLRWKHLIYVKEAHIALLQMLSKYHLANQDNKILT